MAYRELKVKGITWIDGVNLSRVEISDLLNKYNFHELDIEACLEGNQRARLDKYDDYLFLVLYFPKFNVKTKRHELKEFNVFIGKDFIITLRGFYTHHIDNIFKSYESMDVSSDEDFKLTSAFILYEVIQAMLEKVFKVGDNIRRDIMRLEDVAFVKPVETDIRKILILKRNIIVLKHNFKPQVYVMKMLELNIKGLFDNELEVYFEDLEDKIQFVINELKILEENVDSVEESFKSIVEMKTNFVIKMLTLFSSFFLPLTLVTSFYGMNVNLPFQEEPYFVFGVLAISLCAMISTYFVLKKNKKF